MRHARSDYDQRVQDALPPEMGGIPADEPVFLLRASDAAAPFVVLYWANWVELNGGDPKVIEAAQNQAAAMLEWQQARGKKMPDAPEGKLKKREDIVPSANRPVPAGGG